ncbi:hypothetical protein COCON_G00046400, partial [Conger conger]
RKKIPKTPRLCNKGCQSYATISDSLRHDERAVWAHLEPILKEVKEQNPSVTTLHFMSDGPVTQYRNKRNFYLLSTLPFLWGFKEITWNYSEKAHGKGAPDGVGGAIKRCADDIVKMGTDIQTPKDLYCTLQENTSSTIRYFWISEDDVSRHDDAVPSQLPVVKGTMKLHQVASQTPGNISHRELSCFCSRGGSHCNCYGPVDVDFNQEGSEETASTSSNSTRFNQEGSEETASTSSNSTLQPTQNNTPDLVGKFVVVKYDDQLLVGQVLHLVENEIEVSCMRQTAGKNSFMWPETCDVIFYYMSDVQAVISEPEPSTNHSSKLCSPDWEKFKEMM